MLIRRYGYIGSFAFRPADHDRVYTSTSSASDSGSCLLSSCCGYPSAQYFNGSADSIQTGSDSGSSIIIRRWGNLISSTFSCNASALDYNRSCPTVLICTFVTCCSFSSDTGGPIGTSHCLQSSGTILRNNQCCPFFHLNSGSMLQPQKFIVSF